MRPSTRSSLAVRVALALAALAAAGLAVAQGTSKVEGLMIKQKAAEDVAGAAHKDAGAAKGSSGASADYGNAGKSPTGAAHKDAPAPTRGVLINPLEGAAVKGDGGAIKGAPDKDGTTGILIGLTPKPEAGAAMAGDAAKSGDPTRAQGGAKAGAAHKESPAATGAFKYAPTDLGAQKMQPAAVAPGSAVSLNPQPLPPGGAAALPAGATPLMAPTTAAPTVRAPVAAPALPAVQAPPMQAKPALSPAITPGLAPAPGMTK